MRSQKRYGGYFWILIILIFTLMALPVMGAEVETPPISKFDVYEADIREVFRSLGELGKVSVLIDPNVKGKVTTNMKSGLTAKEAIELLAQTYGYSYRWIPVNRTVIIGSEKTFANFDARHTKVYQLKYADPEQVVKSLEVILNKKKIGIDKRTNQLTITANMLQHDNIKEIVTRLDREMPQINIEVRVEEIKRSVIDKLGLEWDSDDLMFNFSNLNLYQSLTGGDFIPKLNLWEEQSLAKLLSNPKICTTDSQEGSVFIGDKYPLIIRETEDSSVTYKVSYIDIGTRLSVTPRINDDDIVTVTVNANVSSLTEFRKAGDNEIPIVRNREAKSVIRLRDGQTFVLSGLSEMNRLEKTGKIKGLGNIPLLGWLFKTKKTMPNEDTEVCIFITPRIMRLTKKEVKKEVEKPKEPAPSTIERVKSVQKKVEEEPAVEPQPKQKKGTTQQVKAAVKEAPKVAVASNQVAVVTPKVVAQPKKDPFVLTKQKKVSVGKKAARSSEKVSRKAQAQKQLSALSLKMIPASGMKIQLRLKQPETVARLARKFGISQKSILRDNNLTGAVKLKPGQNVTVTVPKSHLYILKAKETLWRLAKRYGTTVKNLMEINRIRDLGNLEIGQIIILPRSAQKVVRKYY